MMSLELIRRFVDTAPNPETFRDTKPSLLVCWWCTCYAATVIVIRVLGRYGRADKIFKEDAVMLVAVVPLLLRMAFTHPVLLFGTNNVITDGLSEWNIHRRVKGSQLVMVSRIFYPAFLWTIKFSQTFFLRNLTASVWQSSHQKLLRYLHIFLLTTFIATIVSDFTACVPFSDNWTVVPAPTSQCRQNYTHLLTTGILHIVTNLVMVVFPIPMILKSRLPRKLKATIILRLSLPLLNIALTAFNLPHIVSPEHLGNQTYRSLLASFDILLTAFTSNAVVLLSLLQDRGYKAPRYKGIVEREFRVTSQTGYRKGESPKGGDWGDEEELVKNGGKEGSVVEMRAFSETSDGRSSSLGRKSLKVPDKAKLQEIRVATTWDIKVEEERV